MSFDGMLLGNEMNSDGMPLLYVMQVCEQRRVQLCPPVVD